MPGSSRTDGKVGDALLGSAYPIPDTRTVSSGLAVSVGSGNQGVAG